MDLFSSSNVKLSLAQATGNDIDPTNSVVLVQTTIDSTTNANEGKVEFSLSSISLRPGTNYYFILEATGGSFKMTSQQPFLFDIIGEMWRYSNSTWNDSPSYDFSFSLSGDC